jgi:hypothetical protein
LLGAYVSGPVMLTATDKVPEKVDFRCTGAARGSGRDGVGLQSREIVTWVELLSASSLRDTTVKGASCRLAVPTLVAAPCLYPCRTYL